MWKFNYMKVVSEKHVKPKVKEPREDVVSEDWQVLHSTDGGLLLQTTVNGEIKKAVITDIVFELFTTGIAEEAQREVEEALAKGKKPDENHLLGRLSNKELQQLIVKKHRNLGMPCSEKKAPCLIERFCPDFSQSFNPARVALLQGHKLAGQGRYFSSLPCGQVPEINDLDGLRKQSKQLKVADMLDKLDFFGEEAATDE
jgi:hypothetical protein